MVMARTRAALRQSRRVEGGFRDLHKSCMLCTRKQLEASTATMIGLDQACVLSLETQEEGQATCYSNKER